METTSVVIPFNIRFKAAMLSGQKTWTSRPRQYGKIGYTFQVLAEHL